ncbi:AMP-binding protein [uncultured Sphingomonas sp.]|uniref:AMP-binding protein n=1 Tax=uncultured Sphingomonas sp. TaxID=158754 RepID=UPI00262E8612|nr:AMP-binding protein [uncultured Sphingomonas sp.]
MAAQFNLADLFEIVAGAVGERIAISHDGGAISYAELNARADRLAAALADRGIARGATVGLYLMNGPEYLEGFLAAMKCGAAPFNINYRYRAGELRHVLDNAGAAAVIHGAEFTPVLREIRADLPALKAAIAVEDGSGADIAGSERYEDLLATAPRAGFDRGEDDIILIYTGGTTGMPKGVMWPHKALLFACLGGGGHFHPDGPIAAPEEIANRAREGHPLRMFPIAPLMHGAATWGAWSALLGGLTVVLDPIRRFDPVAIWDRVEREQVNIIAIVGDAMAVPLCDALHANPDRWSLRSVVNFGSGGAVFSGHVKEAIKAKLPPHAMVTDGMGSTETGISGMAEASADGVMRLPANADQQVVVGDRFAVAGEIGLIARSGHTPIGYFGDPVKTAETFRMIEGRLWAVSGDSGRLDPDGRITMFGRGATCINTGGEKVFPEEVETALRTHPAILDAVVAGQKDSRWGERVIGIVSRRDGAAEPSFEDVAAHLKRQLAGYKVPKALVWVDAVKRSPAGKQDYRWAMELAGRA